MNADAHNCGISVRRGGPAHPTPAILVGGDVVAPPVAPDDDEPGGALLEAATDVVARVLGWLAGRSWRGRAVRVEILQHCIFPTGTDAELGRRLGCTRAVISKWRLSLEGAVPELKRGRSR